MPAVQRKFVAVVSVYFPKDEAILKRIYAGEKIAPGERGEIVQVKPGEVFEFPSVVPAATIRNLLEKGRIAIPEETPAPPAEAEAEQAPAAEPDLETAEAEEVSDG